MNESAAIATEAEKACYKELDVDEYKIIATLDKRTSQICREMDGKHFPVSEMKAGVTAPPFHPWCRTDTAPYFDDWEEMGISPERAARDQADQVYYVPENMTYREWEKMTNNVVEQNFRSTAIDTSHSMEFSNGAGKATAYKVPDSRYGIYFSENVHLKPKEMHDMEQILDDVYSLLGNPSKNRPTVIVISAGEVSENAVATYNCVQNTIKIYSGLVTSNVSSLQAGCAYPNDKRSTLLHELIHWTDAQKYREKYGNITNTAQAIEYRKWIQNKGKKAVYKLLQKGYNIDDISGYAKVALYQEDSATHEYRYDEVYTEYRTRLLLEKK